MIDGGLRIIPPYLLQLEQDWELSSSRRKLEVEHGAMVRRKLMAELTGNESAADVVTKVWRIVRRELGIGVRANPVR